MRKGTWVLVLVSGLLASVSASGEDTGFLTDYSQLEDRPGNFITRVYKAPNAEQRLADYSAVLVDQPEVFISADSPYKGAKGDHLKLLADVARLSVAQQLEANGFRVADEDELEPDVLYMRWAISDLYLKKKSRGVLSYTPAGMVVHATKNAVVKDLWKKINIMEVGLEVELSDLQTGEILAAGVSGQQGVRKGAGQKAELVSWQELEAMFDTVGARMSCVMSNARLPESEWEPCADIWVEAEED